MRMRNFKMHKFTPPQIGVNLSSTFAIKNVCTECGKSPSHHYTAYLPNYWLDPRSSQAIFDWYKKFIKRMNSSWYRNHQPRHFFSMKSFNFSWMEKSYTPALHQHAIGDEEVNVVDYLTCPCGKSVWAFAQKSAQNRIEIRNRKAKYNYPRKFQSF